MRYVCSLKWPVEKEMVEMQKMTVADSNVSVSEVINGLKEEIRGRRAKPHPSTRLRLPLRLSLPNSIEGFKEVLMLSWVIEQPPSYLSSSTWPYSETQDCK